MLQLASCPWLPSLCFPCWRGGLWNAEWYLLLVKLVGCSFAELPLSRDARSGLVLRGCSDFRPRPGGSDLGTRVSLSLSALPRRVPPILWGLAGLSPPCLPSLRTASCGHDHI